MKLIGYKWMTLILFCYESFSLKSKDPVFQLIDLVIKIK